jgi:hypothetical protein
VKLVSVLGFGVLLACCNVKATPPMGGIEPVEQRVASACSVAETVVLVQLSAVQIETFPGGERQTARLEVVRVFKGKAEDAPRQVSRSFSYEPVMDDFPTRLNARPQYVLFVRAGHPGTETLLPSGPYREASLERIVELTDSACQARLSPTSSTESSLQFDAAKRSG